MKKSYLRSLMFCCLFVLFLCGCENNLNDMEKELKAAKKKGYSVELSTKYDAGDNVVYSLMRIYSEEQEIKKIEFDEEERLIKSIFYNVEEDFFNYTTYEYY